MTLALLLAWLLVACAIALAVGAVIRHRPPYEPDGAKAPASVSFTVAWLEKAFEDRPPLYDWAEDEDRG